MFLSLHNVKDKSINDYDGNAFDERIIIISTPIELFKNEGNKQETYEAQVE